MSTWSAGNATTFQLPPVGAHAAKLIRIVDIGTQTGTYNGEPTIKRQCILTWELPLELMDDGQPYIISKFYTASVGEKANLTKDLTNWLGKAPKAPFTLDDQKALLGKACQVIVSEKEGTGKKSVSSVAPLPKGVTLPKDTHNPIVFFSLDAYDSEVYESLGNGIKGMIAKSPEYIDLISNEIEPEIEDDEPQEIPF